jgi:GrpB-like predicted nucleotidyltransferase (UPF0157 family)/GNAT superfamily N-acetyltransferase
VAGMMRKVEVVGYNPDWPVQFEGEAARLRSVFDAELVALHPIGSTAVPGLAAKPVIDILVEVRDIQRVDGLNPAMEALGYTARGEMDIPGRRFFSRQMGEERTHHVHVFQSGSAHIERHLAFRDFLRTHPAAARRYGELKLALAERFPADIVGYMEGKDAFVKQTERLALAWSRHRQLEYRPLTPETWPDFEQLFGPKGAAGGCWCMWWFKRGKDFWSGQGEDNRQALQAMVAGGRVPGLLAYAEGKPVGWAAFGPREGYTRLQYSKVLARVDEKPVWSLVCFFVARGWRRKGVTSGLVIAAIEAIRAQGGQVVEAYPVEPGQANTADAFVFTGLASSFRKLGFVEAARRSETRPIMRLALE